MTIGKNIFFGVAAAAVVFCASCGKKDDQPTKGPLEVPVVKIASETIEIPIEFIGQTRGAVDAEIRARVEGVIQGVHFQEGKEINEGELLYTIDPAPYEAKLAEAKARLSEAETKLVRAKSDLGRQRKLAATKAASQRDLDLAIAQEGVAQGGVAAATASVDAANIELGYTKIAAPVSGTIGLTKAKVGEFVGRPPNPVVLNTVSQMDPIHVRFGVAENDYMYFARLKHEAAGRDEEARVFKLSLILSDGSVLPGEGKLISIDSKIEASTGTVTAEASFPNPGKIIRPGQFAKIRTTRDTMKDVIAVPKKALRDLQGLKQIVVVGPENKTEVRSVKVGQSIGDRIIVTEGLKPGEMIVPEMQLRLASGTVVNPKL